MKAIVNLRADTHQTLSDDPDERVNDALRLWSLLKNPEEVLDAHEDEYDE